MIWKTMRYDRFEWHNWFAWFPVKINEWRNNGKIISQQAWLTVVRRKRRSEGWGRGWSYSPRGY